MTDEQTLVLEGFEAGANAAAWLFNGGTDENDAAAFLAALEEGDPEALDRVPCSPLSGEYAGGLTEADVFALLDREVGEDDDDRDDLLSAFEDGYSAGAMYEAETVAAFYAGCQTAQQAESMKLGDARRIKQAAEQHVNDYFGPAKV